MFVNRREVTIEWGDCDPAGIVFFPNYLKYFDAATNTLFLSALGLNKYEMIRKYGISGIPLVDVGARFFIPSVFGEVVTIESTVAEIKRSSFRMQHRLLKGDALAIDETVSSGRHQCLQDDGLPCAEVNVVARSELYPAAGLDSKCAIAVEFSVS